MKTWLTLRLEAGKVSAKATGTEDMTDEKGVSHTVAFSADVEIPKDVQQSLQAIMDAEIKSNLSRQVQVALARHIVHLEDRGRINKQFAEKLNPSGTLETKKV